MVVYSLVISRSGFGAILMIPGTISLEITYSRSRQNPILKISNFPANSGKVRLYPNEKVPSVAIEYSLSTRPGNGHLS